MRIDWKKLVRLAVLTGLTVLLLRGLFIARCDGGEAEAPARNSPSVMVFDHRTGACQAMALETYLVGVTAAEMPVSFPVEALKAQSVAARTYTVCHMLEAGCRQYDADVCTDSSCCQAYLSDARMRERWGDAYDENRRKVAKAVAATAGKVMLYEGRPIEALYHSASGGRTENVEDVYNTALPYLRSVMSTAEAGTPRLASSKVIALADFCAAVNARFAGAKLTPRNAAGATLIEETTASGRVKRIRFGGATATGRQVRGLFSLDSALFILTFSPDSVTIETRGYGHGVGMSQTGANVMALGGCTYEAILHYYYTDIDIGDAAWDAA